jgi:hypothetical protein
MSTVRSGFIHHWQQLLTVVLLFFPFQAAHCTEPGFNIELKVTGGAHRVFQQKNDSRALEIIGWSTDGTAHDLNVNIRALDFFDRPTNVGASSVDLHLLATGSRSLKVLPLDADIGYYVVVAQCKENENTLTRTVDFGVVWPPYPGIRPNSFFGSNVGPKTGEDLQLLETIGMKVQRTHFVPPVTAKTITWPAEFPAGEPVPLNFEKLDEAWNSLREHGLWVLPVVGYALGGASVFDRTPLATSLGMYGPPNDEARFIRTWEVVLRHYPEITTLELWNEPWIFGWTWAASADDYRQFQKDWCAMALRVNPHYRLLAGNSAAFVRDIIEPYPDCWEGLIQGITQHPYTLGVVEPNWRGGDVFRAIDEIGLAARDLGLRYAYLTEGGTLYSQRRSADDAEPFNNIENAEKLVQYYVAAALAGLYMGNAQWEIGYGPGWTRSNTAFAVMTHFLEDRVPLVDIWPSEELLWGGIFASSKFATPEIRALPRGDELAARWEVEVPAERQDDNTKVAVLWGLTGSSARQLDQTGELVIPDCSDLQAFNLVGQEIPPVEGQLILPLTSAPVYITTDRLSVLELRERINLGIIRNITPINFYPFSLLKPIAERQNLSVRVQSQLNRYLQGTLVLHVTGSDQTNSARFALRPGELAELQIPWPQLPSSADNRYQITLTAYFDDDFGGFGQAFPPISQTNQISVASFQKASIQITGQLADWDGLTPVTVESDWYQRKEDATTRLLNPNSQANANESTSKRIVGNVFAAYDDDFVYLGAAVNEDRFYCSAGEPAVRAGGSGTISLPYKQGTPDGLDYVTGCGHVFQFSFGFRDRAPHIGRQMHDPWAWKGDFYDTDYSFVAHASADGDKLIRIWGPDTSRRNGYQTDTVPGIESVPGGQVKITRDEQRKLTLYELAIPRSQLGLFNPSAGRCRFGFILFNGEKIAGGELPWSDVAGVFDYWRSIGSFPPTWKNPYACETWFGIN